jgi:hypothetical protein
MVLRVTSGPGKIELRPAVVKRIENPPDRWAARRAGDPASQPCGPGSLLSGGPRGWVVCGVNSGVRGRGAGDGARASARACAAPRGRRRRGRAARPPLGVGPRPRPPVRPETGLPRRSAHAPRSQLTRPPHATWRIRAHSHANTCAPALQVGRFALTHRHSTRTTGAAGGSRPPPPGPPARASLRWLRRPGAEVLKDSDGPGRDRDRAPRMKPANLWASS